ncbi:hypothetical protein CMALT394_610010 [Carnobacterium maltaromaticum]|nr:hypothetical protein CMALT394_610010 [Carnobacterium maltaromaticum]
MTLLNRYLIYIFKGTYLCYFVIFNIKCLQWGICDSVIGL